jgi:hypothetical protein
VKDNGFSYFLAFFYAQVVGLPAQTVGLAIMLALVIDAFIDPIVGQLSDNTRSRWGRRHPWMYAAALPVAISYSLIWNPPTAWSQPAQVAYLVAVAVLIRSFISCYEIPSAALAAELTTEYDERTRLLSYRYLFGWAGGLAMYGLALFVFLTPTEKYAVGQLNPEGYARLRPVRRRDDAVRHSRHLDRHPPPDPVPARPAAAADHAGPPGARTVRRHGQPQLRDDLRLGDLPLRLASAWASRSTSISRLTTSSSPPPRSHSSASPA